jgi:hypothetical protein
MNRTTVASLAAMMKQTDLVKLVATPYTDTGMYRGWLREDGVVEVRIYER